MTSAIARLRARHRRPRVAHDATAAGAGPSCRASAPTTGSRSRSARRRAGYLTLGSYPADSGVAYVLRTTDGGRHWRPQRIASGEFPGTEGVISPSATRSYALTSTPAAGSGVVPQPVHHRHRR